MHCKYLVLNDFNNIFYLKFHVLFHIVPVSVGIDFC